MFLLVDDISRQFFKFDRNWKIYKYEAIHYKEHQEDNMGIK